MEIFYELNIIRGAGCSTLIFLKSLWRYVRNRRWSPLQVYTNPEHLFCSSDTNRLLLFPSFTVLHHNFRRQSANEIKRHMSTYSASKSLQDSMPLQNSMVAILMDCCYCLPLRFYITTPATSQPMYEIKQSFGHISIYSASL